MLVSCRPYRTNSNNRYTIRRTAIASARYTGFTVSQCIGRLVIRAEVGQMLPMTRKYRVLFTGKGAAS